MPSSLCFRNFFGEAHAARTQDATFTIQHDGRTEIDNFVFFHSWLGHFGIVLAELHVLILQTALTGLIADRAIERMIDQVEIKTPLNGVFNGFRVVVDDHAFFDFGVAGDLQLGHAFDLHHAQTANARDKLKARMPAVVTDIDGRLALKAWMIDDARGDFDFFAVNLDLRHERPSLQSGLLTGCNLQIRARNLVTN